jgi:hypothetical protein
MLWRHAAHDGRAVRLAYCLNLHPGGTPAEILEGLREVTLPLRERLAPGRTFGVGMYVPAAAAAALAVGEANPAREELRAFLAEHGLDPFTWNAFPYGGFHSGGLKERVFEPTWAEPERVVFTTDVATLAADLAGEPEAGRHLSISTHTGMHSSRVADGDPDLAERALATVAAGLAGLEEQSGWRTVLSLEAEPRANCNDTAGLAALRAELAAVGPVEVLARHLGTCLDTCHAAVEFEPAAQALANATAHDAPLGKLQFTSALALRDPADDEAGRRALLALDEPVFLHQVTGRSPAGLVRAGDLPEVDPGAERWRACDEWRCHFHVPVDLAVVDGGLGTTRAAADELLEAALADPSRWGTDELHLEIETYTWDVLPGSARGTGELVDGLEREYRHVFGRLTAAGWNPA